MELINTYHKNKGISKLFSEVITIDWYDGTTTGVCKLSQSNEWYVCNMCYFDPDKRIRIFILIRVFDKWMDESKKVETYRGNNERDYTSMNELASLAFKGYQDQSFLMKADGINSLSYEIVELPISELRFFGTIDETFDQKFRTKWISYFDKT